MRAAPIRDPFDQRWPEVAARAFGRPTRRRVHGQEVVVEAGSIVKFPQSVMHDVRNLGPVRCVIMFLKVNPKVLSAKADG